MTILVGGVFCAGGFSNNMQCDSPQLTSTQLQQWAHLVPDPLGRNFNVLRCFITQGAYDAAPSSSALRSEIQGIAATTPWGAEYTYYWRMIVPPGWINYGPSSYCAFFQIHDVDAPNIARQPTFIGTVIDNTIYIRLAKTAVPSGAVVATLPFVAGQEIEIFVRARWADGTNDADANGKILIYIDGALMYSDIGNRNTWDNGSPPETAPPFLKCGIYQPNHGDSWWAGKQLTVYHVAAIVGDAHETLATMQAYVSAALSANPNTLKVSNGWTTH